jgi:hypothetical protein
MRCNIHGGGMGAVAYERMVSELGQEYVNEMKRDSLKTVKALDQYLLQLSEYKQVL